MMCHARVCVCVCRLACLVVVACLLACLLACLRRCAANTRTPLAKFTPSTYVSARARVRVCACVYLLRLKSKRSHAARSRHPARTTSSSCFYYYSSWCYRRCRLSVQARGGVQGLVQVHHDNDAAASDEACVHAWRSPSEAQVQAVAVGRLHATTGSAGGANALAWLSGTAALCVLLDSSSSSSSSSSNTATPIVCQHPAPDKRRLLTGLCFVPGGGGGGGGGIVVGDVEGGLAVFDCREGGAGDAFLRSPSPVSYTHLTLPTIYSV